jgi:hypothetical protein
MTIRRERIGKIDKNLCDRKRMRRERGGMTEERGMWDKEGLGKGMPEEGCSRKSAKNVIL